MNGFWHYMGGTVVRPRGTLTGLVDDPRRLKQAFAAVAFIGVLYTLTVIGLASAQVQIVVEPWLAVPAATYYFWEIFFALPVFVLVWILAAGLAHLLSKPFAGRGSFEGTLAALGFALTIPAFVTWIPETVNTLLIVTGVITEAEWLAWNSEPGLWRLFWDVYQFVALGWYLLLFPVAVWAAQKVRWWQAALVGTATVAVAGFIMLIFIR
jgi:hypothetical protein